MTRNVKKNSKNNTQEKTLNLPDGWNSDDSQNYPPYNPPKYPMRSRGTQDFLKNFTISTQDKIECGKSDSFAQIKCIDNAAFCAKCKKSFSENDSVLKCEGKCGHSFHIKCVEITCNQFKKIKQLEDITLWLCTICKTSLQKSENNYVANNFNFTIDQLEDFKNSFNQIRNDIQNLRSDISKPSTISYASAVKKTPERLVGVNSKKIIIKPKVKEPIDVTNENIKKRINPRLVKAPISDYKTTKNGFVILNSQSKEDTERLYEMVKSELCNDYIVEISKLKKPRVVITGLNQKYESNIELLDELRDLNQSIDDEDLLDIKYTRQSKFNKKWILYAETNAKTFKKIVNKELNIEWGQCKVFEDLNILRCFRCSSFGHKTKDCKNPQKVCAHCSGNHNKYICKKERLRCINCFYAKGENGKGDIGHSSDDVNCPIYAKKIVTSRSRINYEEN